MRNDIVGAAPSRGFQSPLSVLVEKRPYRPILSDVERRAYVAAHRLMTESTVSETLACPGGRRSAQVDAIAQIIRECFEERVNVT
jgi:hypothetical protein